MGLKLATTRETINPVAQAIVNKLNNLGVKTIGVYEPIEGKVTTGYPLKLELSTTISQVMRKREDIALAIGVDFVTIERVEDRVVVFVPKKDREVIKFYTALYWFLRDEKVKEMDLPLLIGENFQGDEFALDLAKQPHILIAGSTGSGKSVFMSNIISSMYMINEIDEVQFYLVDTKGLDLNLFENLPNVEKYVRDIQDWYIVIEALIVEVEHRAAILRQTGVRNIKEYNNVRESKMPYIVLIIDELADLMEKDKYERKNYKRKEQPHLTVEESIKRLIQICRAVGIHIIAGTQRTSTDIVSGVIKANFPTRIALKVASGIDSRTILDQNGAEELLGLGDMLIKSNTKDVIERYHAPYVRLEDIELVLTQRDRILESLNLKLIGE